MPRLRSGGFVPASEVVETLAIPFPQAPPPAGERRPGPRKPRERHQQSAETDTGPSGDVDRAAPPRSTTDFRSFPWPDQIPGLGYRRAVPFAHCAHCGPAVHLEQRGTFASYGSTPLCLKHAQAAEREVLQPRGRL